MKHRIATLLFAAVLAGCGGDNKSGKSGDAANPYPPIPTGSGTLNANKNLAFLQTSFSSAVISPAPWTGYWWPYSTDGVGVAASKYDAVNSTDAVSWEVGHHGTGLGGVLDWWGHCNGWTGAALLSHEPRDAKSIGGVNFSVADRKALLSETFMEVTGDFLGTRNEDNDPNSNSFLDIVPAQFYLMITNVMGVQNRAFAMDRFTGNEVWNHPTVAYFNAPVKPEDYLGPDPQFPNVHRVNMSTEIWWVDDNVDPDTVTPAFDHANPAPVFGSRVLRYELWLDAPPQFDGTGNLTASGNVVLVNEGGRSVGGVWKNGSLPAVNSHPDYMWIPAGPAAASGFKNPVIQDSWVLSNMQGS